MGMNLEYLMKITVNQNGPDRYGMRMKIMDILLVHQHRLQRMVHV